MLTNWEDAYHLTCFDLFTYNWFAMSEQKSSGSTLSQMPGIAVVAMILGFLVYKDTAFESSRPAMTEVEKISTEDVRARLWQDPFEAVELHIKQPERTKEEVDSSKIIPLTTNSDYAIQMGEAPQRICNTGNNDPAHSIEELRCQIQRDTSEDELLHVLAVMVPGGPYAEDREWRLRYRYAVISQLTDLDYVPDDPEHVGFVDFLHACKTKKDKKFCDWPNHMPYEWFGKDQNEYIGNLGQSKLPDRVLVLWLDNDAFTLNKDPLNMLDRLKDGVTPGTNSELFGKTKHKKSSFNIIGPHSSDTMKLILQKAEKYEEKKCSKEDSDSKSSKNDLCESLIFSPTAMANQNNEWIDKRFIRTTPTNKDLVERIFNELTLRRIDIKCDLDDKPCPNSKGESDKKHIVLIGESDTLYSLDLIQRFFYRHDPSKAKIHRFSYLRGIDGINAIESQESRKQDKKESKSYSQKKASIEKEQRRPEGSNQFDYLRRLATRMQEIHQIKDGGIKAIGILGNDPYDKLLILQALHKKFPQAIFFTTDLDSRFFHPAERPWTRNLIVASPYGLTLHPNLQKHTPPFRDAYQTAIYLTTKLAVECQRNNEDIQCIKGSISKNIIKLLKKDPQSLTRLFEIGNDGPVDFSGVGTKGCKYNCINLFKGDTTKEDKLEEDSKIDPIQIHPDPRILSDEIIKDQLRVLTVLLVTTVFLYFLAPAYLKAYLKYIGFSVLFLTGVFIILVCFTDYPIQKNFSFIEGTNTWPANAIRIFAITLAGVFIYHIKTLIENSSKAIQNQFLFSLSISPATTCFQTRFRIDKWGRKNSTVDVYSLWNEFLYMKKLRNRSTRIFFSILLFIICFCFIIDGDFDSVFAVPSRGDASHNLNYGVFIVSILAYWVLVFFIVDISHLNSHFISLLINNKIIWPPCKVNQYCQQYDLPEDIAKQKLLMDLVNKIATAINTFIYYPFIVLFLLILSRSHYFDNWHYTPQLLTVIGLTVVTAVLSAYRIRKAAIKAREHILGELEHPYRKAMLHKGEEHSHGTVLLVEEIRDLKTGPFLPLSQHPIVLSFLLPIGSIGGLYLIEHFMTLN